MVQHFEKETGTLYDMEDEGDSMLWLFGRIFVFVTTACWIMLKFGFKLLWWLIDTVYKIAVELFFSPTEKEDKDDRDRIKNKRYIKR